MKTTSKLSLLTIALLAVGCNEKVSPELMSGSATGDGVAVPPSEYYFNVTNTSSPLLNYNLHKTGASNQLAKCEIKSNNMLSNEVFRGAPANNDITCFFDAEELSLLHGGINFSVNASANTCDYVGYSPFSFYKRMPGNSTATYQEIDCTNDTTNSTHVVTEATTQGVSLVASNGALSCGDIALNDSGLPHANRVKFQIANDEELCRFNYEASGGDNCDIGIITIDTLEVTNTPGEAPAPDILKSVKSKRVVDCGGKVQACVAGPISLISQNATRITEITESELNKPYTKDYELPDLYDVENEGTTVKNYVNFRRNLASTQIDYIASSDTNYAGKFSNTFVGKIFNPSVVDFYSSNKMLDGTALISDPLIALYSYPENKYKAVPLAAEPFLGLSGYRVNPFYTFYCFDTAFDVKARIRMMVREFDRVSPGAQYNDFLSDVWRGADARQDNLTEVELNDQQDRFFVFNDLGDWDDQIPMRRSLGMYDPSATVWQPEASGIYFHGWFNPAIFPGGGL